MHLGPWESSGWMLSCASGVVNATGQIVWWTTQAMCRRCDGMGLGSLCLCFILASAPYE